MVPRERLIRKLEDLGLRLADFGVLNLLFKGTVDGKVRFTSVQRHDLIDDEYVRQALRQAGCEHDAIETFIANNQGG